MAFDEDGRILGARAANLADVGAFPVGGVDIGVGLLVYFPGPYRMPALVTDETALWTSTCGRGPYRGPWQIETLAREQTIDAAARELGLDPLELRRRNILVASDLPYKLPTGPIYDRITPSDTLEQAAAMIDYDGFRREQASARAQGRHLGLGISAYIEPTTQALGPLAVETATVRVEPDGTVNVVLGTGSHGQSIETTMAQVVAEHLGVAYDDVVVLQGDTAVVPFGAGTGGSRTAVAGGGASRLAALQVREQALTLAAHLMEAAPADLELAGGVVSVRGTPARSITLAEVARAAHLFPLSLPEGVPPGLEATIRYEAPPVTFSNACHICTCEVDVRTGAVILLRYVVSEDCGVVINPMVVEGQIAGGVAQAVGGVLYEDFIYDDDGNPLTTTFLDYLLPTAGEVPTIEYGHIETPSASAGGHKGMGEGGAICGPPAIFNAVADALAPLGVVLDRYPLTPSAILKALDTARRG